MLRATGLACLWLAACAGLTPERHRPVVEVLPPTGTKPHRLSAAELPPDGESLREFLEGQGLTLRGEGTRDRLSLRHAPLDLRAESALLSRFSLREESFSDPVAFGPEDVIRIRNVKGTEVPVGFTLNLVPRTREGALSGFSAGAVVRPERGTLLPVLRGDLTLSRTGTALLVGTVDTQVVLACLIRIEIRGTSARSRLPVPTGHLLSVTPYRIRTELLTGLLRDAGLPEAGDSGGLAALHLTPAREAAVREGLRLNGDPGPPGVHPASEPLRLGAIRIEVRPEYRPRDYRYRTVFLRKTARVLADHPVQDALLLIVWDGDGRGRSHVALIRLRPDGG